MSITPSTFPARSARLAALRASGKAPLSYDVLFSEAQRQALIGVLYAYPFTLPEALEGWIEMLGGLPQAEAESPGCTHGFCL